MAYLTKSSCLVQQDTLLSNAVLLKYQILARTVSLLCLRAQRTCLGWGMELPEGSLQH